MSSIVDPLHRLLRRLTRLLPAGQRLPLEENSPLQRQMLENCATSLMLVDARHPNLPIVYVNHAFERLTGYPAAEVIGRSSDFLQGNDEAQEGTTAMRRAAALGEVCTVVMRACRKDGTMFWNEMHITPLRDASGSVTHFLGEQHDVSARKAGESALAQHVLGQRQIFDSNRAVKLLIDPTTGAIRDANPAALEFYGYSLAQITSMRIQDINMLPDAQVFEEMQRAVAQERTFFEFRHRLASGEVRDVDVFSSAVDLPEGQFLYSIIVDVTGRREAEQRYRSLFEQSNDAVMIADLSGHYRHANRRAAQMLGYSPEEFIGLTYRDLVVPEQHESSAGFLGRMLAGEHLPPIERTFRRKDGSQLFVEVNIEIVRASDGQPLHIQSIVRDITERKRMEKILREKYAELDHFFAVTPDLLCIANTDGNFLKVNTAWETVLGYPVRMLENSEFLDFVHPDDVAATADALHSPAEPDRPSAFTTRCRAHDGTYRILEWHAQRHGKLIYMAARDITERVRMEDELRASEHKFRALVEQSSDGVAMTDEQGRVIEWNDSMARITGVLTQNALDRPIWDVQYALATPERRATVTYDALKAAVEAVLETGSAPWLNHPLESVVQRADGTQTIAQAVTFVVKTAAGYRAASVVRDTTQRKQAEDAVRQSEERLRSLVESQTAFVIRSDMEGRYTYANRAFTDWLKRPVEDIIGTPVLDSIHLVDHPKMIAAAEACLAQPGLPVQVALTKALADGTTRSTLWEFIALQDQAGTVREIQCMGFDITRQRELETALMESEARYRAAIEASMNAYYLLESVRGEDGTIVDFRFVQANENGVREMGLPRETLIGGLICELFPINRTGGYFERYRHVVETGEPLEEEYLIPSGNTAAGWYHHQVVRVGDGVAIMNRNITARKTAEEALHQTSERQRMILEGTRAGTWEWTIPTGETVFNEGWAAIIGYTLDELGPVSIQTWLDLAHPEDLQRSEALLRRHFAGETAYYECEARMRHKDGRWIWVLDRGTVMAWTDDGQPLRMFGTHLDITERKRMEEALRQSEKRFSSAFRNSPVPMVMSTTDPNNPIYLEANDAYMQLVGFTWPELQGRSLTEIGIAIRDDERDTRMSDLEEIGLYNMRQARIRSRSGEIRDVVISAQRLETETGTYDIEILLDVTERNRAQQREFELALERERTTLLTRFIQNTAHEFRTPLTVIGSSAYLMTRLDDAERRRLKGQQIDAEIKRVTRLVDTLLLLAEIETTGTLECVPVDLAVVLDSCCRSLRQGAEGQPTLRCDIPASFPLVLGDVRYLAVACSQLLDNAVRFTPAGGTVTVTGGTDAGGVWLEISDTGAGIAEEHLPHIFETFWRHDDAHTTPGFGLGLPIAQRIIEHHSGSITAASRVGAGSRFRITLPIAPAG